MESPSDYEYIIDKARWDPKRIVAGTLTNEDNGDGFVSPSQVVDSVKRLSKKYRGFGGVAAWEYFNSLPDQKRPWEWARMINSAMNSTPSLSSRLPPSRHPVQSKKQPQPLHVAGTISSTSGINGNNPINIEWGLVDYLQRHGGMPVHSALIPKGMNASLVREYETDDGCLVDVVGGEAN